MTRINIGTNKKNIVGVEIDKPFDEIKFADIQLIVKTRFGTITGINIHGWCLIDSKCDNCGKSETSQALTNKGDVHWCLDCMRCAGLCITCEAYIPKLVANYEDYESDQCPGCE